MDAVCVCGTLHADHVPQAVLLTVDAGLAILKKQL